MRRANTKERSTVQFPLEMRFTHQLITLVVIIAVCFAACVDAFFNFSVLDQEMSFVAGDMECKARGYDGFAAASSPEAFHHLLKVSYHTRKVLGRTVYIGVVANPSLRQSVWSDGSLLASDLPFEFEEFPSFRARIYHAYLQIDGLLKSDTGLKHRYGVCGHYTDQSSVGQGSTSQGQQPVDESSKLFERHAESYLQCVFLCARDSDCRLAEFNSDLLTCTALGPGTSRDLTANPASVTFTRTDFAEA